MLGQGSEKIARYNLATCAIRIVQVLASNQTCILGMAKAGVIVVIVRSLKPLQRDAAFTLEALKIMLQTGGRRVCVCVCVGMETLLRVFLSVAWF